VILDLVRASYHVINFVPAAIPKNAEAAIMAVRYLHDALRDPRVRDFIPKLEHFRLPRA
jgi:hypothetical protein